MDPGGDAALGVWLTDAARGDERALGALYDATSRRVYGLALQILRDPALAEEATLDVFTQVWRRAGGYDATRGTPLAYLLTLARTRAIDLLRARSRRAAREDELPAEFAVADPGPDPFAERHDAERADMVRRAVSALPTEQRRAIEAAYFGGLSHSEAAAALGAPLGTVKTRIRDGLTSLRRALNAPHEGTAQ